MEKIIGRQDELRILERLYRSKTAEFLAIYGRRRIGKTFLIRRFFKNLGVYFEVTGSKDSPKEQQIGNFYREFVSLFKSKNENNPPKNWDEAFHLLQQEISKIPSSQKIILFLTNFLGYVLQNRDFYRL